MRYLTTASAYDVSPLRCAALFAVLVSTFLTYPVKANDNATKADKPAAVRLSWQDFVKDPANLASLRKAVAVMRARDSAPQTSREYRMSWTYWANMHGYFGPDSPFGDVARWKQLAIHSVGIGSAKYFDGIADTVPPDQVARDVWANCQHGTAWFFAWHRLYLLYFEKQLQSASGNSNLRLPYWDYTNVSQLAMPAEFTQPTYKDSNGRDVPNPLFENRRAPAWLNSATKLDSVSTDVTDALTNFNTFTEYQDEIQNNIHGYIHCTVGPINCPVVTMGAVPYSSNDPIFWLHHANIDRLWSCWSNMKGHSNPGDDDFAKQPFSFIDEHGDEVTNKVGELFNGKLIDYKYEQEVDCGRGPAASVQISGQSVLSEASVRSLLSTPKTLNVSTKPILLTQQTTTVQVSFLQAPEMKQLMSLALFSTRLFVRRLA